MAAGGDGAPLVKGQEQKLHAPKHPRLWVMEKRTSSMAGDAPHGVVHGMGPHYKGSSATASSSAVVRG